MNVNSIGFKETPEVLFIGPPKSAGPLPAFFYFALSAKASLTQDPICQPVSFLASNAVRIFSMTLPAHEEGEDQKKGVEHWPSLLSMEPSPFDAFFNGCKKNLHTLIETGWIDPKKIAFGGLSRGSWIASQLAAQEEAVSILLGFAPMTAFLSNEKSHPELNKYQMIHLAPRLAKKTMRFYIGNRDLRVGTKEAFSCVERIVEEAHAQGLRSAPIELILFPSIGHLGHGTPPSIFKDGIEWLKTLWDI